MEEKVSEPKKRCRETNEWSCQGWVARDVREPCTRMSGHHGKHSNRRWQWEGHGGKPELRNALYAAPEGK